jgi:hypothetical protein
MNDTLASGYNFFSETTVPYNDPQAHMVITNNGLFNAQYGTIFKRALLTDYVNATTANNSTRFAALPQLALPENPSLENVYIAAIPSAIPGDTIFAIIEITNIFKNDHLEFSVKK